MTIGKCTGVSNQDLTVLHSHERPPQLKIKQVFSEVNHAKPLFKCHDEYDLSMDQYIHHVYSDVERLNKVETISHLTFHDIISFNKPLLALEQIIKSVTDKKGISVQDLLFIGLSQEVLVSLIQRNTSLSVGEIIEDYIRKYSDFGATVTCGYMREIAMKILFDLDLLLTSKFAAFPNDPYIVFTLRLLGVYDVSTFLEMLKSHEEDALFYEAVNEFVGNSELIVREMTVNKYLKILLALPEKNVHLKKVFFHQGGIFYKGVGREFISRYAELEVLGISSVSELIQVLLPTSGRKENLLAHLEKWVKKNRENCTRRTCSEQRHIWSGLLIPGEANKICDESVHPYFMYRGGVLYHTDNRQLKKLNGKVLNYLGLGLLSYWEDRFRSEEAIDAGITVIEVIRKVAEERQCDIVRYFSYTEKKIRMLIRGEEGTCGYIGDRRQELREAYLARPDLFYKILHSTNNYERLGILRGLLHEIPDIAIRYLHTSEYYLLETLDADEVARILVEVPWAWSAFPVKILNDFSRRSHLILNWENVLSNPLSWKTIADSGSKELLIKKISDSPICRRIFNELDSETENAFKSFITRMVNGDPALTEKVERLFELGPRSWMMLIDPKHHEYGPFAYDAGYHGGLVEKGYLEGMYAGLVWCAFRLSKEESPDDEFAAYQLLNKIVYSHNYRKVGGELRSDDVMRHNNTKISKTTLEMEIEGVKEWDHNIAYPIVPVSDIESMIVDETDTTDRFTIQFKEATNIKKYLQSQVYEPYNETVKVGKKRQRVLQATARKHKQKELLHVFRDGVSRSNWLELNLDLVRHGMPITIIEPNDSYTYPERKWAKIIGQNPDS